MKRVILIVLVWMVGVHAESVQDYLDKMREKSIGELRILLEPIGFAASSYDITSQFGIYGGNYDQVPRLAYIGFPPQMVLSNVPHNLQGQLFAQTGINSMAELVKKKNVFTQITFFGNIGNSRQTYNTLYHQFTEWITRLKEPNVN